MPDIPAHHRALGRYYDSILTVVKEEEGTHEAYEDAHEDADVVADVGYAKADVEDDVYHDTTPTAHEPDHEQWSDARGLDGGLDTVPEQQEIPTTPVTNANS